MCVTYLSAACHRIFPSVFLGHLPFSTMCRLWVSSHRFHRSPNLPTLLDLRASPQGPPSPLLKVLIVFLVARPCLRGWQASLACTPSISSCPALVSPLVSSPVFIALTGPVPAIKRLSSSGAYKNIIQEWYSSIHERHGFMRSIPCGNQPSPPV